MRLYFDACAIIYGIEGAPPVREAAVRFVEQAEAAAEGEDVPVMHAPRDGGRISPALNPERGLAAGWLRCWRASSR